MKATQGNTLNAGRRVQGFLDTHASVIGTVVSPALRGKLDAAVTQLGQSQLEQDATTAGAIGATAAQNALRSNLFEHFSAPIGRIAKVAFKGQTDLPAMVVLAETVRSKEFIAKVTSQIDAAEPHAQTFIDNGIRADFVAQVRAAIAELQASAGNKARLLSRRSAASAGLKAADAAVKDNFAVLNGVMGPVLKQDPSLAADWMASKRIKQTVVTPLPAGEVSTPTAPAAPAAPPATPEPGSTGTTA